MRIIDAHLHLFPEEEPEFETMAQAVGHHAVHHIHGQNEANGRQPHGAQPLADNHRVGHIAQGPSQG